MYVCVCVTNYHKTHDKLQDKILYEMAINI